MTLAHDNLNFSTFNFVVWKTHLHTISLTSIGIFAHMGSIWLSIVIYFHGWCIRGHLYNIDLIIDVLPKAWYCGMWMMEKSDYEGSLWTEVDDILENPIGVL
ncbi:hypothetical protein ACJX0J_022557, partial [Zea mays]